MEVLFSFLFWVASFSHVDEETGSKMDMHNLATVMTPNVLYAKGKDGSPLVDDSFSAIEVVKCLIQNTQEFSQVLLFTFKNANRRFLRIWLQSCQIQHYLLRRLN
jgi:RhoGAP domain